MEFFFKRLAVVGNLGEVYRSVINKGLTNLPHLFDGQWRDNGGCPCLFSLIIL